MDFTTSLKNLKIRQKITLTDGGIKRQTYPQVSVGQVWVLVSGVGAINGLFAVDLDDAAVLNVPRVLQLVEDVTGLIFDQQRRVRRPEHQ